MQTKDGAIASGLVGSEVLALLCLVMLPEMLHRLLARCGCEVGSSGHDELCKAYADAIGHPQLWPYIYYPFPLSLDNDSRHAWGRDSLLQPRLTDKQAAALEKELQTAERNAVIRDIAEHIMAGMRSRMRVTEQLARIVIELAKEQERDPEQRKQALDRIEQRTGLPFRLAEKRRLMKDRPWLRIVLPQQFMPLTKVSPEINMPVEHRVDDVKGDLCDSVWQLLCTVLEERILFDARTYQLMVELAVQKRSNEAGRNAIFGSIRKQRQCCRALAANTDECVVLIRPSKKWRHLTVGVMAGTAGDCVPGRWT